MVERNNPLTQVLVFSEATQEAADNSNLSTIAGADRMGFVNYDNNLSFIAGNIPTNLTKFYVAYSPNANESPFLKSAGDYIDVKGIYDVTKVKCHLSQAQIIDVKMGTINCSDNFGLRFSIKNGETMYINGTNPLIKSFVVSPQCPEDDCACPEGNCVTTAFNLAHAINLDPDGLFTAQVGYYAYPMGNGGASNIYGFTPVADVTAWNALVASSDFEVDIDGDNTLDTSLLEADCPIIRITTVPASIESYCAFSLNYLPLPETSILVSPIDGMVSNGSTITEIQSLTYARGTGYQVRIMEYLAGGFNGDPGVLRASAYYGVGAMNFTSYADLNKMYVLYYISYSNNVTGGFGSYKDTMRTILAVPVTDCNASPTLLENSIDNMFSHLSNNYNFHMSGDF